MEIRSVYGPPHKADPFLCADILRRSEETPLALVAVGDWNWKPSYTNALASNWKDIPSESTVQKHDTRPTRCITTAEQDGPTSTFSVIGIPHHKAVLYSLKIPVTPPSKKARLRKCTAYKWVEAPTPEQSELLSSRQPTGPRPH